MENIRNETNTYIQKRKHRITERTVCRILFFSCFFSAILLANLGWKNEASWIGYLNENSFIQYLAGADAQDRGVAVIFWQRLPYWILFLCFSQTLPGLFYAFFFAGWQGMSAGFIFSALIARYGLRGFPVFACMVFPQILFYLPAWICAYRLMFGWRREKMLHRVSGTNVMPLKQRVLYIVCCIILSFVFLTGIFCECRANPFFLRLAARLL